MTAKPCRRALSSVAAGLVLVGALCASAPAQVKLPRVRPIRSGLAMQPLPVRAKTPRSPIVLNKAVRFPGVLPIQRGEATRTTLQGYIGSGDVMSRFTTLNMTFSTDPMLKMEAVSEEPTVAWLAWQVSSMPYPPRTTEWEHPAGLIDCRVESGGTKTSNVNRFKIDLGSLARVLHRDEAPADATWQTLISLGSGKSGEPRPYRGLMARPPKKVPSKVPDAGWYYIRVVPLKADGQLAGAPSNVVTIHSQPPPSSVQFVSPDQSELDQTVRPDVAVEAWSPVQFEAFDAAFHVVMVRDMLDPLTNKVLIAKGTHVDMQPRSKDQGFWDWLCDAIEGFFNFVEQAANWVSNAYASIKTAAIDLGCSVLGEWAREGLTFALDTGLAAIGLPPSLPSFDDLKGMGKDYLVDLAGEQIGVPGVAEAAGKAVDEMCKQTSAARNGAGDTSVWFVPDPGFLYRPACLYVTLRNGTGKTTHPLWLRVRTEGMVTSKVWVTEPFKDKRIPIPALPPGKTLRVPIYLDTQLEDPRLYNAYTAEVTSLWWQNYNGTDNMRLSVATYFRPTKTVKQQPTGSVYKEHFARRITGSKSYQWSQ